jgi:nitrite reductase/ring-hydroxylating ferredoxin subunit
MDRRNFIKQTCTACLSFTVVSSIATSCVSTQYISGNLAKDGISLSKEDFQIKKRGGTAYSSFIIIRNEALKYPICVYRLNEDTYSALWMQCTHQGTELQASGDVLQCAAHGSEFNNRGEVRNGPAGTALRTFPVSVTNNEIFIDLRKRS